MSGWYGNYYAVVAHHSGHYNPRITLFKTIEDAKKFATIENFNSLEVSIEHIENLQLGGTLYRTGKKRLVKVK